MRIKVTFCFYQHPDAEHMLHEWELSMNSRIGYKQRFGANEIVYMLTTEHQNYEYEVLFATPLGGKRFSDKKQSNWLLLIKREIRKTLARVFGLNHRKEISVLKDYKVLIFGKVTSEQVGIIHSGMEMADNER